MDDEFELRRQRLEHRGAPPDTLAAAPEREPPEEVDSPRRRLTRRARLRRAMITVGAVALALAILAAMLPNSGATLRALLNIPTPAPTATLAPGAGMFLLSDGVFWGTLLVDGHAPRVAVPPPDFPGGPSGALRFVLGPGRYTIKYRAAPFPTLRCMVSVPATPADDCPLVPAGSGADPGRPFVAARVLDLEARPERLSGAPLTSLEQMVVAGLDASMPPETLAAGDHYRGADGSVHTASQPLQAALNVTLNEDPNELLPGDSGPCETLCFSNQGFFPSVGDQGFWTIAAHVILAWRITRPDGSVVEANVPAAPVAHDAHLLARVSLRWSGSWALAPNVGAQLDPCVVAGVTMTDEIVAEAHGQGPLGYVQSLEQPPTATDDCLVVEMKLDASGGTSATTQALILYRCGALVATNDWAHAYFPSLPQAGAHELALAHSLASQG